MPFGLLPSCQLSLQGYDISKSLGHAVALGIDLLLLELVLPFHSKLLHLFLCPMCFLTKCGLRCYLVVLNWC